VIWNLVPVGLLGVVGLGLSFVIARWWGAAAFGVFNLVTTAYSALAVLGACGLQYSVLHAIAEQPEDRARVAALVVGALVPNLVLAAAATLGFVALRPLVVRWLDSPAVGEGMLWAAPGLFCFAINKVLLGVVNGLRRMRAFAIYTSLRYLLIAAGLGLARAADLASEHVAAIWTFTEAALLVVLACELVATVSLARGRGWTAWVGRHLGYGARGVVATLAYEVNSKLDVWMVGVLVADKAAIGIYALAAALNEGVAQLAVVVQNNLDPLLARALAGSERDEIHAMVARTRRWFVPALIAVCVLSAGGFPLAIPSLIGDHAFAAGALPFAILMIGSAIASPYLPFAHLLLMAKRPGWHTVLLVAAISVNALGAVTLIPALGLAGAAASTSATLVFAALVLRVVARRQVSVVL